MSFKPCLALLAISAPALFASNSLLVGFNTLTPLQSYSTSGSYQQDFGPTAASAAVQQGGLLYVVQPNTSTFNSSTVTAYNSSQHAVSSFHISDAIGDGAPGQNGSLWLAGYDGVVYNVSTSGTVLSSFNIGYKHAGIASNGSTLYTTRGDAVSGWDGIDVRNTSGKITATIYTGFGPLYGLAYDTSANVFYAASFGYVYSFTSSGSLISINYIGGDGRTPNGAIHDGLEVVNLSALSAQAVPATPTLPLPTPGATALLGMLACFGMLLGFRPSRILLWGMARPVALPLFALAGSTLFATVNVNLHASSGSIPVGGTITFTATASDTTSSSATFNYKFAVRPHGTPSYTTLKDYYYTNTFAWTPSSNEGSFDILVVVHSSSGGSGVAGDTVSVTSRVTGSSPVVSSTNNPLVALYSAPPCTAGKTVRVRYKATGDTQWHLTHFQPCTTGQSVNFYIGGMRPSTTYALQQDTYNGPFDTPGAPLTFTTGKVNDSTIPSVSITTAAHPPTSNSYPIVLKMGLPAPFAIDVNNNIVWYNQQFQRPDSGYMTRAVYGGTFLGLQDDPIASDEVCATPRSGGCGDHQYVREYDMAGNIIRETNWTILQQEINGFRKKEGKFLVNLDFLSHDVIRLPNGYTATMATDEQIRNQGSGNVDVLGDIVIVMDQNLQVVWFWDSFDYLDVTRPALLNNVCTAGGAGCPAHFYNIDPSTGKPYTQANDWTHMNSIWYIPSDGNMIFSIRHQAWVVKVNYDNASGDGDIIWKLGPDGSFSLPSGVSTDAWFNYQHDAEFQPNGLFTVFDNNNVGFAHGGEHSKGQSWNLDQTNLIAYPVKNYDLGVFSGALGSAQLLLNGDYSFGAGYIAGANNTASFAVYGILAERNDRVQGPDQHGDLSLVQSPRSLLVPAGRVAVNRAGHARHSSYVRRVGVRHARPLTRHLKANQLVLVQVQRETVQRLRRRGAPAWRDKLTRQHILRDPHAQEPEILIVIGF